MSPEQASAQLSPAERQLFEESPDREYFPAGTVLMHEGEPGTRMFVLVDGEIAITYQGRPLDHLYPGTIVGEMAMVDDRPRSATAIAATDCCAVPIDRARFNELVSQSPDFAARVMTIMSFRLRRLLDEEVKRQRMEEELAIGRNIQISLLPADCPQYDGWDCVAYYQAAREVGGDLYDFIVSPSDPERLHIAIADVSGKGVPAALYMAVSRTVLRSAAIDDYRPSETLQRVNRFISQDVRSQLFLSAFFMTLDTRTGHMAYARAGHNPPYWYHAEDGRVEALDAQGVLLGTFNGPPPEERTCIMAPGDVLVLFTDGVSEARNPAGGFFDEERLETLIARQPWQGAQELLEAILDAIAEFVDGTPLGDDITLVVLRRLP